MTKSAREVIEAAVYAALGCTDTNKFQSASEQIATFVTNELAANGLVILPKEPSEGMIEAGLQATMAEIFDAPADSDTLAVVRNKATAACYRAMISHAEGEKDS